MVSDWYTIEKPDLIEESGDLGRSWRDIAIAF